MAIQTVSAIYENGVFRPIEPQVIKLTDGQTVRLVVEPVDRADAILALATSVYNGLSEKEIDEIEQIIRRRDDFFGERTEVE
jgi:predicted DNA-binding antitoxin AbrB/MazE fold protein